MYRHKASRQTVVVKLDLSSIHQGSAVVTPCEETC